MIEVLKQALEALEYYGWHTDDCDTLECDCGYDKAITSLRQAIAKAEDNYQGSDAAKAAHMMDLYTALGVRWGDDPFAVIAKMRSIAELESQEPVATGMKKLTVTLQDRPIDLELAQYKRMFEAACSALGAVSDALGCDPEEGGAEPLLIAIEELKSHPPQRTWQGLTDEEAQWLYDKCRTPSTLIDMVEAKLKEKNT